MNETERRIYLTNKDPNKPPIDFSRHWAYDRWEEIYKTYAEPAEMGIIYVEMPYGAEFAGERI